MIAPLRCQAEARRLGKGFKRSGQHTHGHMPKPSNMRELVESKKFLFFGGKGGVGKTTMASTTATWLADHGYKTLIVATDPTISLSAIYEQEISESEVVPIGSTGNLYGLNINPKKAMGVFQTRMNEMMEGFSTMFGSELLSTPCTEEIAAFDQFVSYMADTEHDKVVFDTAPTGHTLREHALRLVRVHSKSDREPKGDVRGAGLHLRRGHDRRPP